MHSPLVAMRGMIERECARALRRGGTGALHFNRRAGLLYLRNRLSCDDFRARPAGRELQSNGSRQTELVLGYPVEVNIGDAIIY